MYVECRLDEARKAYEENSFSLCNNETLEEQIRESEALNKMIKAYMKKNQENQKKKIRIEETLARVKTILLKTSTTQ